MREKNAGYSKTFDNTVRQLDKFSEEFMLIFASARDLKEIFKLMDIQNE
jgi:hypothetical protein